MRQKPDGFLIALLLRLRRSRIQVYSALGLRQQQDPTEERARLQEELQLQTHYHLSLPVNTGTI